MKLFLMIFSFVAVTANLAHADQCQSLSEDSATLASIYILGASKIQSFCEPCGDKAPQTIANVDSVVVAKNISKITGNVDHGVLLHNNKGYQTIDAAYTYVDGKNLATLIQCPVEGVSERIR